jgi:myo-inositol 2-dehydrogenase/D-chiro-inositol 1-dehydrogenase
MPNDKKINVGVIGLGRAGHVHLGSLSKLTTKARIAWVVDINADTVKRICDEYGCKGSTSIDDALADPELDAVIIASATFTHFDYTMRVLTAKKAVFTEKPISHDPAELMQVLNLAIGSKLIFCTGYQRRCDKNFRALKRQLELGAVGAPRVIKCTSR